MNNNIIAKMNKEVKSSEKSKAVQAREEQARRELLNRYGVDDTRTLTAEAESEIFRRDSIEQAGLTDLYSIASAIAYKKMRFKYGQGYDSFAVTNQSLHDELADCAVVGMTGYIHEYHVHEYHPTYGVLTYETAIPIALVDDVEAVIRAGYAAMDSFINQTARDERKHMYADISYRDDDGEELFQDVTAVIESGFEDSELFDVYERVVSALKPRQVQVFKYMLKGYTDETIAKRLKCNRRNVVKLKHVIRKRLAFVRDELK